MGDKSLEMADDDLTYGVTQLSLVDMEARGGDIKDKKTSLDNNSHRLAAQLDSTRGTNMTRLSGQRYFTDDVSDTKFNFNKR